MSGAYKKCNRYIIEVVTNSEDGMWWLHRPYYAGFYREARYSIVKAGIVIPETETLTS